MSLELRERLNLKINLNPFFILISEKHESTDYEFEYLLINNERLFNFETYREASHNDPKSFADATSTLNEKEYENLWYDKFNGRNDHLRYGPQGLGLDFTFKNNVGLFGIPEHADSYFLRDTAD